MDLKPHIEKFRQRFAEVEALLSDPKTFANNQKFQELSREYARLKDLVSNGEAYLRVERDLADNRALLGSETENSELAHMAREEIARLEPEEKRLALAVQAGLLPADPTDSRNTIIEIRAGAVVPNPPSLPPTFTACTCATPKPAAGKWKQWIPTRPTSAASRR
jgi:peptide chain release factor 1